MTGMHLKAVPAPQPQDAAHTTGIPRAYRRRRWGYRSIRAGAARIAGRDPGTVRREGVLSRLTLNRPEALNALDPAMIRALAAALAVWEHEDEVRAVLLDGDARSPATPSRTSR